MKLTRTIWNHLTSRTGRLTLSYLLIIMVMSIGFSTILYHTSSEQLGRQMPPDGYRQNIEPEQLSDRDSSQRNLDQFLYTRISEGRHQLIIQFLLINVGALVGGTLLSYLLARRTLEPIEAAMEAQSRFIGDASHELRTPLTAIRTSNEVMLRRKTLGISEAREALASNIEEVGRLQELTDSLLSLAKQEKLTLHTTQTDTSAVLADALNRVVAAAQAKDIAVEDQTKPHIITTDKAKLEQVVVILLDNAIKYSHEHSTVTVTSSKKGKYFSFSVHDTGIGIRATDLPNIFKRFYRADQSRTKNTRSGYGLGLAIADNIVTQLGGEIIAESELGKGSTFTIKLPIS